MFTQEQQKSATMDSFAEQVKIALIRRKKSVTWLAQKIKRQRSSVSRAIHGADFPRIRESIRKALSL